MAVYDDCMAYFKARRLVNYHKYAPFYLAQIGAHIANLYNKGFVKNYPAWFTRAGKIVDLRIHTMAVGPPGSGKTFWIEEFLHHETGLLRGISFPVEFHNKATLKGLIGGWDKTGARCYGEFEDNASGIFGFEEWMGLMKAGKQEHSLDLEEQMLPILDSGRITAKVGDHPKIEFTTYVSIMAGTQSERFDLASGMARRLTFLNLTPDVEAWKALAANYDDTMGLKPDFKVIRAIRAGFEKLFTDFAVKDVEFSPRYVEFRNKLVPDHILKGYVDRYAVGYSLVRNYRGQSTLQIVLDKPLETLLLALLEMRWECLGGTSESVVLKLLGEKEWQLAELKNALKYYSMKYSDATKLLDSMLQTGKIEFSMKAGQGGCKKKITTVKRIDQHEGPDWASFLE